MVSDPMHHDYSERAQRAHAFLFAEGGSLTWKRLAQYLDGTEDDTKETVRELARKLEGSGLSIIVSEREVTLATSPSMSEAIKAVFHAQLQRDIGDAGLEVIAIVLYCGHSTRTEIDYIRGVNTSSTIRTLLFRGLIERIPAPSDAREYLYRPTVELLAHLGVGRVEELLEYDTIRGELAAFEDSRTPFQGYVGNDRNDRAEKHTE